MNESRVSQAIAIWILAFLMVLLGLPVVLVAGRELAGNPGIVVIAAIFASIVAVVEYVS